MKIRLHYGHEMMTIANGIISRTELDTFGVRCIYVCVCIYESVFVCLSVVVKTRVNASDTRALLAREIKNDFCGHDDRQDIGVN